MPFNQKRYEEIRDEISENCGCHGKYCFFRELTDHKHVDIRTLVQFEAIYRLKFIKSQEAGKDIGAHDAGMIWVTEGLARAFAEVYDEDLSVKEIFKRTLEKAKSP